MKALNVLFTGCVFALSAISFVSCSKDDDSSKGDDGESKVNPIFVKKIGDRQLTAADGYNYTYNSDGTLAKATDFNHTYNVTYGQNSVIFTSDSLSKLYCKIDCQLNTEGYVTNMVVDRDVKSDIISSKGVIEVTTRYTETSQFTYSGSHLVKSVSLIKDDASTEKDTTVVEWSNGNISQILTKNKYTNNTQTNKYVFSYTGGVTNKFGQSSWQPSYIAGISVAGMLAYLGYFGTWGDTFPSSMKESDNWGEESNLDFTFSIDSEGYLNGYSLKGRELNTYTYK